MTGCARRDGCGWTSVGCAGGSPGIVAATASDSPDLDPSTRLACRVDHNPSVWLPDLVRQAVRGRLEAEHFGVAPIVAHQFVMVSALDHPAGLEYVDAIR